MAQTVLLVSAAVGAALLVVVAAFVNGERQRSLPVVQRPDGEGRGLSAAAVRASHHPAVWVLAFLLGTLVLGGGTLLVVSGASLPEGVQPLVVGVVGVGLAAVVGFYLFYGTVVTARNHGLANAQAVALGSWLLGLALVAAVVAKLLGAF